VKTGDLFRESARALLANRSRLVLTGLGITVGTMALVLILSLALGLNGVIDRMLASDEQLRHVMVMPGFGTVGKMGTAPEVKGEMGDDKRARLRRTLLKRGYGGPPFQIPVRMIDADTERELAALPGVESSRAFIQDRYGVELLGDGGATSARDALSIGTPAKHAYYPKRLLAGRWFTDDDEHAIVVHELLLYEMGFTSDAAQTALVGRKLRLTAKSGGGGMAAFLPSSGTSKAAPLFSEDVTIVGVLRERFGSESAAFVDEIWAMQADLFLPQGFARTLWDRRPNREGPRSMLLVARSTEETQAVEEAATARGLQVRSVREAFDGIKKWLRGATIVAGFLSLVAVFVAALGIVNTMVMSVLERTREIGLLKSLGATDGDVAALFLAESGILGLTGGLLGVGTSLALGAIGNHVGRGMIEQQMMMPFEGTLFAFPWWLVTGGLAFALVVGLAAALVPAMRAARVDPVVALRHE
jgi:putative ABC transport system permease protein